MNDVPLHVRAAKVLGLLVVAMVVPSASARAQQPATVVFFGGYQASASDVASWRNAAQGHPRYGSEFRFEAVPYPSGASARESSAVEKGRGTIERYARRIADEPGRQWVVVGHSSGAALAAAVVERVRDPGRILLIILDDGIDTGFRPPSGFDPDRQMACWSAVNARLASFNRDATRRLCRNYREIERADCSTRMCLHFKLVNDNAPSGLARPVAGYVQVSPFLEWLEFAGPRARH